MKLFVHSAKFITKAREVMGLSALIQLQDYVLLLTQLQDTPSSELNHQRTSHHDVDIQQIDQFGF